MTLSRTETASRWMQADLRSRGSINGGCADTSLRIASLESKRQSQAKLAYLFELGVSAELREEDGTHAGEQRLDSDY